MLYNVTLRQMSGARRLATPLTSRNFTRALCGLIPHSAEIAARIKAAYYSVRWLFNREMLERIEGVIQQFFAETAKPADILYNEASLQHEIALFLRPRLADGERLYIERPASSFRPNGAKLVKKEIDLAVTDAAEKSVVAIELKCPRQGQHPEQMFKACQDIQFLEELVAIGFTGGLFVMHVRDRLFYESGSRAGIYAHFRAGAPICGTVQKPTGARNLTARIRGNYCTRWLADNGDGRYWLQSVSAAEPAVAADSGLGIRSNP